MKLFILLLTLWLVLNESAAPAHLLGGAAFALLATAAFARLEPHAPRWGRPVAVAALLARFVADMVRSNFAVARIVLGLGGRRRTAGFVTVPLRLRHPAALAALACIVTSTPGTSWILYDRAENRLTIHVLDLVDEAAWVALFKHSYERRLMEIFE
jgi:multicomponent K+:H+ antiporter subunit E